MKQKLREAEEEKVALNEEINAAKVKHGKLTLKAKQLAKELQNRKSMTPESTFGSDSLDKAIQDELNQRAEKAEKSLKELQAQNSELTKEKSRLTERIDTLEAGNERFMELKESQDQEVRNLKVLLKDLQSQVNGFDWQLSEKDSQIEDLETQVQALNQSGDDNSEAIDNSNLKVELIGLKRQVTELEASNAMLKRQVDELEENLQASTSENVDLASQLLDVQDQMDNMNEDYERLKNVEVQYDSLKLKLDFMESEKQVTQDYENFQNLNHDMQQEIVSLRSYINQQNMVNSALQQQIQTSGNDLNNVKKIRFIVTEKNYLKSSLYTVSEKIREINYFTINFTLN